MNSIIVKLKNLPRPLRLGLIVLVVVTLLGAIWFKSQQRTVKPPLTANSPIITPSIKLKLAEQLPHITESFAVDYLESSNTFTVEIFAEPVETSKNLARDYLKSQGIDLATAKINFYLVPGLGESVGP